MPNDILKGIADNPALFEALKASLFKHFSLDVVDTEQTNQHIGEMVRAKLEGRALLEVAFREIERLRTLPEVTNTKNPAR